MKKIFFICLFVITSGCTVFQPEESTLIQPALLKQSELPPLRESITNNYFEFYCEMMINTNGDVERARILAGSNDPVWDSLAVLSLMEWKYAPAIYGGHPINLLVRRKVKVVYAEPRYISLAEIQCDSREDADKAYSELLNGIDFTSLVLKYSTSDSKTKNGLIGNVNLKHFSDDISFAVSKLNEGDFTKPLNYGEHFIIYKRMKLNN
jgi:parvulin-like peptidyl-prolyl isomerase